MKIFFLTLFFLSISINARIRLSSRLSIAEYEEKFARGGLFCIFTSGNSKAYKTEIDLDIQGESQNHIQKWNKFGKEFISRRIEWDTNKTNQSFKINFYAEGLSLNEKHVLIRESKSCSYKYWKSNISNIKNVLKSKADFKIPKNIWVIKIKTEDNNSTGAITKINLFNQEYEKENSDKMFKKKLYSFDSTSIEKYFIVNPSVEKTDNYIHMDILRSKNDVSDDRFIWSLDISFIGQKECFYNLEGKNLKEILQFSIDNKYDKTIENLSCLLSPVYIKHILSNLYLFGVENFFDALDLLRKKLKINPNDLNDIHKIEKIQVIDKLLNRIKFYYSYEISKDIMYLLKYKDDYELNGLQIIESLRLQGTTHLSHISIRISQILRKIKLEEGFINSITNEDMIKLRILGENYLSQEIYGIVQMYNNIHKPKIISSVYFNNLEQSIKNLEIDFLNFNNDLKLLLKESNSTKSQLSTVIESLRILKHSMLNYSQYWESFNQKMFTPDNKIHEILISHKSFLSQIEAYFQINIKSLSLNLNEYFKKNFEDPALKDLFINKKDNSISNAQERLDNNQFDSLDNFINEFEKVIKEQ